MRGLYPGVDLVLREDLGKIKYDLILAPEADLSQVVVRMEGIEGLSLQADGSLVAETAARPLVHTAGKSWQVQESGARQEVVCRHRIIDDRTFGFEVDGRDSALELVIDPALFWATYLGGTLDPGGGLSDIIKAVAVDVDSSVVVAGSAGAVSFPITPGAYFDAPAGDRNIFVAKFDPSGSNLVYSSMIGGFHFQESAYSVAIDSEGRPVVAGETFSTDFPTTPGSFDPLLQSRQGVHVMVAYDGQHSDVLGAQVGHRLLQRP